LGSIRHTIRKANPTNKAATAFPPIITSRRFVWKKLTFMMASDTMAQLVHNIAMREKEAAVDPTNTPMPPQNTLLSRSCNALLLIEIGVVEELEVC
jgi:hypothetical protein